MKIINSIKLWWLGAKRRLLWALLPDVIRAQYKEAINEIETLVNNYGEKGHKNIRRGPIC